MNIFTKKIFSFEDHFFALDISDLSMKVLEIEDAGKFRKIRSVGSIDIPKGFIEDGRVMEKEKVSELIKTAVAASRPKKIRTKKVVCSLPESKAFLRIISIPKMEEGEAAEAVKWEIEASIPISVEQVYFDWQFLDVSEGKQDVLTVAISKEVVDDMAEVIEMAGLEAYGFELESIAEVRSLILSDSPAESTSLVVDLGSKKTSFIITRGTVPYFTSSIPVSSETMSDSISKRLAVSLQEAEEVKISQGIEYSFESNAVFEAVAPLLENLSSEIRKTIDFYQGISRTGSEVGKVILCGGGSNLKGLVPYLTTKLSREVMLGDPWINLGLGDNLPPVNREMSVRYATAVGLVMKKISYGNKD